MIGYIFLEDRGFASFITGIFLLPSLNIWPAYFPPPCGIPFFTYYASDGNGTTGIEWCIYQVCHTLRSKLGGKALIQERTGVQGSNPFVCLGIFLVTLLLSINFIGHKLQM